MRDYFIPSTREPLIKFLSKLYPSDSPKIKGMKIKQLQAWYIRVRENDDRLPDEPRPDYNK